MSKDPELFTARAAALLKENPVVVSVCCALYSNAMFGLYPILLRVLITTYRIPMANVIFVVNTVLAIIGALVCKFRYGFKWLTNKKSVCIVTSVGVLMNLTSVGSVAFTKTFYLGLMGLLAPFICAALSRFIDKSQLNWPFFLAAPLSLAGGILVLSPNFKGTVQPLEILGIVLAIAQAFCTALFIDTNKRFGKQVPFFPLMFCIGVVQSVGGLAWSLATGFSQLGPGTGARAWPILFVCSGCLASANFSQFISANLMGAPFASVMMGFRLICNVIFSWLLLSENIQTLLQWIGIALAVVATSGYLAYNLREARAATLRSRRNLTVVFPYPDFVPDGPPAP